MASLNSLQTRQANEKGVVGQAADAASEVIRLKYVGTGTVTSVIVTTATGIVMITSDGGTDSYTFASKATLGALVDAINADGIFEARIINGLRSTASVSSITGGPTTYTPGTDGYYSLLSLTTNKFLAYRLAYDRTSTGASASKISAGHRVHVLEIVTTLGALGGGADANGLKVVQFNPVTRTEATVWQVTPTASATTTYNWASGEGRITGDDGCELIVYLEDATSIATGLVSVAGIIE